MRGYGQSERPEEIDKYTLLHLVGDMVGLLDALGEPQAVIVGHDWGAPVAWHAALLRPDRFRGVVGLSVHSARACPSDRRAPCRRQVMPTSTSSISKSQVLRSPRPRGIRAPRFARSFTRFRPRDPQLQVPS